jgi:hypothetical protein
MSGKPLISPSDASKYRQQYLATLALQANINDANLQANKIYKRTGQTPTQPTDMRLTSEKLADIERLKIEVRAQLASIMDGQDAQATIASLPTEALQFVSQNINQIVKEIKPQYQLGIPAAAFEVWLNNYMRKSSEVNEVAYGLQQNDGEDVMLGAEQIRELVNEEVLRQVGEIIRRLGQNSPMGRLLERRVEELRPIVELEDQLTTLGQIQNVSTRYSLQRIFNNIYNGIPLQVELYDVINPLFRALDRNDRQLAEVYINKLDELLAVEPSAVVEAQQALLMIEDVGKGDDIPPAEEEIDYGGGGGEGEPSKKSQKRDRDFEYNLLRYERQYGELNPTKYEGVKKSKEELTKEIDEALQIMPYGSRNESKTARAFYINVMGGDKKTQGKLNVAELKQVYSRVIEELSRGKYGGRSDIRNYFQSPPPPSYDNPFDTSSTSTISYSRAPIRFSDEPISVKKGKGIGGRKPITRVVDYSNGIGPIDHYVPFGKIFINTDKLKKGIVSVRKGKGVHITCLKVQRVSPNLNDIIGKVVGGGNPSYTQLSKLNEEEREYLYKLGKHSDLLDKIGVEAPTKADDDADINQFEIYKGQLMSGNDSREMVADFKKLIVKMIGKRLLPPGQAKQLLLDLTEMGY